MNVYNFNYTIYRGYCVLDFYTFALKKHPSLMRFWPHIIVYAFMFLFQRISLARFKQECFCFLKAVEDTDELIESFWDKHEKKIQLWYKEKQTENDVITSASPSFLLEPIAKRLGIRYLIASDVDKKTGVCLGEECRGEEKVNRLRKLFPNLKIENYYSEPMPDKKMLALSTHSYVVDGESIIPVQKYKPKKKNFFRSVFFTRAFLAFITLGLINGSVCIIASTVLSAIMPPNLAFVVGYISSLGVAYVLNTMYIFCQKMSVTRFIQFCASYIPNFAIQNVCVLIFYNTLNMPEFVSFTLSAVLGVPITFTILKMFTFKPKMKK